MWTAAALGPDTDQEQPVPVPLLQQPHRIVPPATLWEAYKDALVSERVVWRDLIVGSRVCAGHERACGVPVEAPGCTRNACSFRPSDSRLEHKRASTARGSLGGHVLLQRARHFAAHGEQQQQQQQPNEGIGGRRSFCRRIRDHAIYFTCCRWYDVRALDADAARLANRVVAVARVACRPACTRRCHPHRERLAATCRPTAASREVALCRQL